jgi:hypothetical protein
MYNAVHDYGNLTLSGNIVYSFSACVCRLISKGPKQRMTSYCAADILIKLE